MPAACRDGGLLFVSDWMEKGKFYLSLFASVPICPAAGATGRCCKAGQAGEDLSIPAKRGSGVSQRGKSK